MNIHNWKIFDKSGSPVNWTPDPLINLIFGTDSTGQGAEGFLVTEPSGYAVDSEITNGGYLYDNDDITLSYTYAFQSDKQILASSDASIVTVDVSIFNPEGANTKSISSLTLDLSTQFIYPSVTYAGAIFLDPISQGLIETEHLFIFEQMDSSYYRPYDASNNTLVFQFVGDESEISFFEVDEDTAEISWTNRLIVDVSSLTPDTPIQLNIGFKSDNEGVYERILRTYHLVGNTLYAIGDIVVNAESIGEDERFRTLINNFGLPDPKDNRYIFKDTDINEDLPDWEFLNYKSKHLILEHDQIMPYIGTYKGLINAIKWLGYDDIYIREWFLNVKENRKVSYVVSFDAADRRQTILTFNADQRKVLKKLNQLSLNYCLTRETGEIDDWGTPETENCYTYNIKEVFIKLLGLKQWLEKNIIGVNCRIVDITGDGIYFERVQNIVYATDNVGYEQKMYQSLTPRGVDGKSELIQGDSSIRLSFLELSRTKIKDLDYRFIDFVDAAWSPDEPSIYYSIEDASYLADPSSFLLIGATFQYPFANISDIMWRLSVEKETAGVVGNTLVTKPLFVYDNDIRFYNTYDTSAEFFDSSTSLTIYLEEAYVRDSNEDEWTNSIAYSIYANPSDNGFIMESSSGDITRFYDYVTFNPDTSALLQYAEDSNYNVPLLSFKNYKYTDGSGVTSSFEAEHTYYLDIIDGKIEMNAGMIDPANSSDNTMMYINWNYDTSLEEQMITVNVIYDSPRMVLWQVDPSVYYWADPSALTGGDDPSIYVFDNSVYKMHVNHIGNYNIELFAWNDYNNMFYNTAKNTYPVWIKHPTVHILIDNSSFMGYESSTFMSIDDVSSLIADDKYPIYDRLIPLQGLTFETDGDGSTYIKVPSITYFQDLPEEDSLNRFYNLTEKILSISGTDVSIDNDYQKFYAGDDVNIVKFDKGKYSLLAEASSHIISASATEPIAATLDQFPSTITEDSSSDIYILNDSYRTTVNVYNTSTNLVLDISGYQFAEKQLVGIIVTDGSTNYSWGASYRVDSVDGSTHTFNYTLPSFFVDDVSKYTIQVKHAFSSFSNLSIYTKSAKEKNNNFEIYLNDSYCQEYYLDDTFVYTNILFDQELVNNQWFDPSADMIYTPYYYYSKFVDIDTSAFVILKADYEPTDYMLSQKNIWTARYHDTNKLLFKVFNYTVPYTFDSSGYYSISVESYDEYGNLIQTI